MQAVTPSLLGVGMIDDYEIRQPLAVWVPTVADEGFLSRDPRICTVANARVRAAASELLRVFSEVSSLLRFPGDMLSALPMGTYVRFRLRCHADILPRALSEMDGASGVAELRYALAAALASVLGRWRRAPPS